MAKIVHVTSVHPALDNRILFKECVSLAAAGHDVVLVAPHERDEIVAGVRIRGFPRAAGRLARMTAGVRRALQLCAEEGGDVVHFHDPELMPGMARLARRGVPVIFDMHENVVADVRGKPWLHPRLRRVVAAAVALGMRAWLRPMRVVFAESSYPASYPWIEGGVVVQNLPRVASLLAVSEPRAALPTVGYLGSITAQRGSLATVEALALLRDRGLEVGFECVGLATPLHLRELAERVDRLRLPRVRVHGYRAPEEAFRIVARCHVGLAILDDDPNLRESYPTKLFEYMALGLPVVVSDFPLWREVVEGAGCGLCIAPGEPVRLAAAIARLVHDPAAAAAMGGRGRAAVRERHRWESEERKLLDLYARVLDEAGAARGRGAGRAAAAAGHAAAAGRDAESVVSAPARSSGRRGRPG